jgi:hypothetical protein
VPRRKNMFRNHRFDGWVKDYGRRLQYVYRSFKVGCRMCYVFGEMIYLKVKTAAGFVIHIINAKTDSVIGTVDDAGRVCQCG